MAAGRRARQPEAGRAQLGQQLGDARQQVTGRDALDEPPVVLVLLLRQPGLLVGARRRPSARQDALQGLHPADPAQGLVRLAVEGDSQAVGQRLGRFRNGGLVAVEPRRIRLLDRIGLEAYAES